MGRRSRRRWPPGRAPKVDLARTYYIRLADGSLFAGTGAELVATVRRALEREGLGPAESEPPPEAAP